ncbi:MAG: PD-(D/E)XK nuclease family protein [Bryobacteraceae bacterium]
MHLAKKDFAAICANGGTIVLPSRLLASVARQQLAAERIQLGLESWERPEILSISAWLVSSWNAARFSGFSVPGLLSPSQEVELWRGLFEELHPAVFDPGGAAGLAIRAAQSIAEWHLPLEGEWWERSADSESYRQLHRRFSRELRDRDCMTRAEIWRALPDWIRSGAYKPAQVTFLGFRQPVAPAMSGIMDALGRSARSLPFDAKRPKPRIPTEQCARFEDEIETAARWARRQIEENPEVTVGVFVPELRSHHQAVARIFDSVLDPPSSLRLDLPDAVSEDVKRPAVHVHASRPLVREPLVTSALTLLELLRARIRITDASAILLSPFLAGAAAERSQRALADLNLRRSREIDVTLSHIQYRTVECEHLAPVWQKIRSIRPKASAMDLIEWSELFGDLVGASGWPGEQPLTTHEQSVAQGWNDALSELGSLGFVSPPVPFEVALSRLRDALGQSRSPETGDELSPVQVLDFEDAEGLQFDCSVAMGVSEEKWPRRSHLVPFIPPAIQRSSESSLSLAQRFQDESEARASALLSTAPNVLVTYSGTLAPAARGLVKTKAGSVPKWLGTTMLASDVRRTDIESIPDRQPPPFRSTASLSGGVGVIRSQAQCPFRAFAEYRLHAQRPEDACFGFDPRERGGYLHRALENVWKRLESSERLLGASDSELQTLVEDSVAEALASERNSPFREVISTAEKLRLNDAILYWLREKEKNRSTPFRVEHIEEKKTVDINGLQLRIRVDRIDRLRDGSVVLIDYKSGEISEASLQGDRPSEPQLLVYAAAMEEEVDGIFLAQVRPREAKTVGCALHSHFPPSRSSKLDWAALRDDSRIYLRDLAREFTAGHAPVDPLPGACKFCNLPALCRVREGAGGLEDEDDD